MMPQPARRDGAIAGITIGTLFHLPIVPAAITPGPWHDVTYDVTHFECTFPEPNNDSDLPRYSTRYTSHASSHNVTFINVNVNVNVDLYVTPLMRYRLECPANRYVFKSRLNCSESTAGFFRQSGSEFQTVGPATEQARVPKVRRRTVQSIKQSLYSLSTNTWY